MSDLIDEPRRNADVANVDRTQKWLRGLLLKANFHRDESAGVISANCVSGWNAGIAIEAGAALVMNRAAVVAAADAAGVFVYGFGATDLFE